MPLNIPPGFGQYVHHFELLGDPELMVITGGWQAADGSVDPNAAADGMHTAMSNMAINRLPNALKLIKTTTTLVTSVGAPPLTGIKVSVQAGGRANASLLTQNVTWLAHKRTALGGRRGQGRWYIPAVPDVSVNDIGALNPNEVTDWNTALATYKQACEALASVEALVVLHGQSTGGGGPLAPSVIVSFDMDLRVATQRNRLRR
jgi:hypothetical protein